jgi:hypothetical protein
MDGGKRGDETTKHTHAQPTVADAGDRFPTSPKQGHGSRDDDDDDGSDDRWAEPGKDRAAPLAVRLGTWNNVLNVDNDR